MIILLTFAIVSAFIVATLAAKSAHRNGKKFTNVHFFGIVALVVAIVIAPSVCEEMALQEGAEQVARFEVDDKTYTVFYNAEDDQYFTIDIDEINPFNMCTKVALDMEEVENYMAMYNALQETNPFVK